MTYDFFTRTHIDGPNNNIIIATVNQRRSGARAHWLTDNSCGRGAQWRSVDWNSSVEDRNDVDGTGEGRSRRGRGGGVTDSPFRSCPVARSRRRTKITTPNVECASRYYHKRESLCARECQGSNPWSKRAYIPVHPPSILPWPTVGVIKERCDTRSNEKFIVFHFNSFTILFRVFCVPIAYRFTLFRFQFFLKSFNRLERVYPYTLYIHKRN